MNQVMSSNFEIDLSAKRPEGFNLSDMKGKRAHQHAETGFDALSSTG